jgi:hypothetical protein
MIFEVVLCFLPVILTSVSQNVQKEVKLALKSSYIIQIFCDALSVIASDIYLRLSAEFFRQSNFSSSLLPLCKSYEALTFIIRINCFYMFYVITFIYSHSILIVILKLSFL